VAATTQRSLALLHVEKPHKPVTTAIKLVTLLVNALIEELLDHPDHALLGHLLMNEAIDVIDAAIETTIDGADLDLQEEIEIPTVLADQVTMIEVLEMIGKDIITVEDEIVMTDTDQEADLLFLVTIKILICVVMIVTDATEITIKTIEEIDMKDLT